MNEKWFVNPKWVARGHRWGRTWTYRWTCTRCGASVYGPTDHRRAHEMGFR